MTNDQAKKEAIENAYGEHEFSSRAIYLMDCNGCIEHQYSNNEMNLYSTLFESNGCGRFRLKSLRGIEYNNGWIRIEPDESNLPEQGKDFKFWNGEEIFIAFNHFPEKLIGTSITHFKPIEKDLPPIY